MISGGYTVCRQSYNFNRRIRMSVQKELRWTTRSARQVKIPVQGVTWVVCRYDGGEGDFDSLRVRGKENESQGLLCYISQPSEFKGLVRSGESFEVMGPVTFSFNTVKETEYPSCSDVLNEMGGEQVVGVALEQVLTALAAQIRGEVRILTIEGATANRFFVTVGRDLILVTIKWTGQSWSMHITRDLEVRCLVPGDRIFYQVLR